MAAKLKPLEFKSVVIQGVRTTVDGGLRLTFDVDSGQTESVAVLLLLRRDDVPVALTVRPE